MSKEITQTNSSGGDNNNAGRDINIIKQIPSQMSVLADIINRLAEINIDDVTAVNDSQTPFTIDAKIQYNSIVKYRDIFNNVKEFYAKLNSLYTELEAAKPGVKSTILLNIQTLYLHEKHKDLTSDTIIDNIFKILYNRVISSQNNQQHTEIVENSLYIILLDAFMRCKILEEPR